MTSQMRIVGTFNLVDGKFVSTDKNRSDFNAGKAVPIPADQIASYYPLKTAASITVGGTLNRLTLKAGESYPVPNGKRIILEATSEHILFTEVFNKKPKLGLYIQSPIGFHQTWLDYIRRSTADNLQATQILAEWELQFLIGVLAGTSWKGLSAVIGMDLFQEAITKQKRKATTSAIRTLQVLFSFKRELRPIAPTLESVISDMLWVSLLKGQTQHLLPTMANDPKVASRAAGTIVTQLSTQALNSRLTVSAFIWTIVSQLGTKALLTMPAAISETANSFQPSTPEAVVEKIKELVSTLGIVLSDTEKTYIFNELKENPQKIRAIFARMVADLKNLPR